MIHSIEYCKYGTAHKNLDVLLYGILLGKECLTVLGYIFIVVDVEILRGLVTVAWYGINSGVGWCVYGWLVTGFGGY